jgi:transposase
LHLNALWYVLRNGIAWRALPREFGRWSTVFQFFNRLSLAGFFDWLHSRLVCGQGAEAVFFDSTHCKVHQHAHGGKHSKMRAVGSSRGGLNTKLHMVADAAGRLAAPVILTAGNISDHTAAPDLTGSLRNTAAVADKGYDSKALRHRLRTRGCEPCIPARSNIKWPEPYDEALYRSRHCIENVFQRIKVFRRVATRYDKTDRMFLLFVTVALSAVYEKNSLWTPM